MPTRTEQTNPWLRPRCRARATLQRRASSLLALICTTWFASGGHAAADSATALSLSLADALQRAAHNAPELVRAQNELRNAEARREGAGLWLSTNPLVSFLIGSRTEQQSVGPALRGVQHQLHVEQALEVAGQRWARLDVVDAAVAAQQDAVAYEQLVARSLIKALYVQCLLVERRLAVAQKREDVARQLLASAETRLQLGATGAIEANLARIEVGRVVSDRADISTERELRLSELRIATGISPAVTITLTTPTMIDTLPGVTLDGEVHQQIEQALSRRLDLHAIQKQRVQIQSDARRLRREVVPNPIVAFDYQQDLAGQIFIGGTLGLTIPIFQRNQGPLAQLLAAERARQAEERLLVTRVRSEVAQALQTLRIRRTQLESFARDALPPAEANIELLHRGWQAGKFDLFRVITALREATELRLRYLTMLEQMWIAGIALERASGVDVLAVEQTPDAHDGGTQR